MMLLSWFLLVGALLAPPLCRAELTNQLRPWLEYRTIMWISNGAYKRPERIPLFFQRLREMGINTGMVYGDGSLQPLLDNNFPYYVENMINRGLCLKYGSKVRDWDKTVTTWAKTGRLDTGLVRDYCLDDPQWRGWARKEMQTLVRKNASHQPLAYDIRDELSTTISANPFDYDFNPITLAKFRDWLKTQYPDLTALNSEWETRFPSWGEVKPFTTDQIKNRMASGQAMPGGQPDWQALQRLKFDPVTARQSPARWNFSPWVDFRSYMDISLSTALDDLRNAARELDPHTPVGIEGTQMPHAFGGYDLWRLSQALDWVEPYDIGNAREIFGSFMPGKPILTTVFEKETNQARRRLWHLLLEGDRGCIVWWSEDCIDWQAQDYALTPKARALAPVLREMTSPLAQIFLRAERDYDPIYIHYSQPSIQVDWLVESIVDGPAWLRRFSSFEAGHNRLAKVRNVWLRLFQDLGYSPKFISSAELEAGVAPGTSSALLVLPQDYALSAKEVAGVKSFLQPAPLAREKGRCVFADGAPGWFDDHGKLRPVNPLEHLFPAATSQDISYVAEHANSESFRGDIATLSIERLKAQPNDAAWKWIAKHDLGRAVMLPAASRTRIHRFRLGPARLLAFERNIDYHVSEDLKQAGGNESLEKPVELAARLLQSFHVYDLRAQKYLGRADVIHFRLDPWQPSLFALLPERLSAEKDVLNSLLPK